MMLLALLEALSWEGGDLRPGMVGEGTGERSLASLAIPHPLRSEQ